MATRLEAPETASATLGHSYRPEILRLSANEGRQRWQALLKEPGVQVFDTIESQLRELVRSLHPSRHFTPEDLTAAADAHLGATPREEYGAWVFYPWSGRLLHLLDEAEFALVRTDRNRNKITREEQRILATKRIGVIGLSVGQSVALTLALERSFGELRIADFDTLDLSNLNRIRSGLHHLGLNKCLNVAREIAEIDPYLEVTCFTEGLNAGNIDRFFTAGGLLDVLVEECDSVDVKILSRQKAKALRVPVVMDTSDRGMVDIERFDLEPDRPLLHGLIDHLDPIAAAKARTSEEKLPFLAPMAGLDDMSPRMKASLLELNQTVGTWPQLATSVVLGGALAADVVRRIALGGSSASGRWYVDLEQLIGGTRDKGAGDLYKDLVPARAEALTLEEMLQRASLLGPGNEVSTALTEEQARAIATAGALAPSAGNMQPWKFLLYQGRLFLFHDRSRSVSKLDPDELIPGIALGACMENMVLRATELGLEITVEVSADAGDPMVAALAVTGERSLQMEKARWPRKIGLRHTNRKKGSGKPIDPLSIQQLEQAANDGTSRSHVITDRERIRSIAAIAGAAERIRILNPYGHLEFFQHEVRWTDAEAARTGDGLDVATLELDQMGRTGLRTASDQHAMALVRSMGGGGGLEKMSSDAVLSSPAVALISIPSHTLVHRLNGGRAAQRFWLAASRLGLAVHPISAAIFLGHAAGILDEDVLTGAERDDLLALRLRLMDLFDLRQREPLFMMRLSHADAATARSLRRPLEQMFHMPHPPTK